MSKNEFLKELENRIKKYPDHNEIVSYYYELIQDKIDSGMTEIEAVESLGSLDKIVRDIEVEKDNQREEMYVKEEVRENKTTTNEVKETKTTEARRMSGGKKFAYVLWTIATIFMCIGSIIVLIVAIAAMVGSIAAMIASITIVATSTSMASFYFGIGLFAFGATLVGVYYAKTLVSFIFHHRPRWKQNVRKGLAGE